MLDSRNRACAYCLQYQALLLEYITLVMIVIQYFGDPWGPLLVGQGGALPPPPKFKT